MSTIFYANCYSPLNNSHIQSSCDDKKIYGTFSWEFIGPVFLVEQTINATGYTNITADHLPLYVVSVFENLVFVQVYASYHLTWFVFYWFQKHNTEFQITSWSPITRWILIYQSTFQVSLNGSQELKNNNFEIYRIYMAVDWTTNTFYHTLFITHI